MSSTYLASATVITASLLLSSTVHAGSIVIDGLGGPVTMNSTTIPGVFDNSSPVFTSAALNAAHSSLHASGISTAGVVTFLLADTDHGLSFMALVDDNTAEVVEGSPLVSQLGMSTTAPATAGHWVNDHNQDITALINPFNLTKTAAGVFSWEQGSGDAFAWSNLNVGDGVTFNFTSFNAPSLVSTDTFQFVSWTGSGWEVVGLGSFSDQGQFAFSFTVVPIPAAVGMGLAGLLGIGAVRLGRRRLRS